ncbi:MAG: GNAT family N-acetyltransferase [Pyrinomonadaceae bacterium]
MSVESPATNITVEFRDVTPDDQPLLFRIYASSREMELSFTGWNLEQQAAFLQHQFQAQQTHYAKYYPNATHQIILANDEAVGRLWVERRKEELLILDLVVLTASRRNGIGSRILQQLKEEAVQLGLPLHISVEMGNPSLAYFQRLGFAVINENGPHFTLEWRPPAE